jgi:peptidylprolyl isomerase
MKKQTLPFSTFVLAAIALPLAAQTASTPMHHTASTVHHTSTVGGGCVRLPEFSSKIPAVPAGSPCAKALYTLTRTPDVHLDYASQLLTPEVRDFLAPEKTTYSLDYIDTFVGSGPLAQPKKWYTVHYTGYLPDGTKFDSSLDRGEPISFPYGQHRVIPGWDTGFEGMHVGGKRRIFVPYELAYGEAGRAPVIPAKSELIFDIELIAQSDEAPKPKAPPTPVPHKPVTPPASAPTTPPTSTTTPASTTTPPPAKPQQ